MVSPKLDPKTRQVAILLTSVDTPTARQLLSQFPTEQAKRIRQAMSQLAGVTPEERRAALEQFQRMTNSSAGTRASEKRETPAERIIQSNQGMDSIELSEQAQSFQATESVSQDVYDKPQARDNAGSQMVGPLAQLSAHDLAELLNSERPIVIAVVLNQIPTNLAASLLQALPEELAIEALGKVPQVQGTAPDILQEIQEQLERRLASHSLPLRAAQEGLQRLRSILDVADHRFRTQCMSHICSQEPNLARRLGWEATLPHPPTFAAPTPAPSERASHLYSPYAPAPIVPPEVQKRERTEEIDVFEETPARAESPTEDGTEPAVLPFPGGKRNPSEDTKQTAIRMSFDEVMMLPASDLVKVLHSATPELVLMAIRGASESFYQRVRKLLSPKDAKRLDAKMVASGAIQLSEVDHAQQQLAAIATELLAAGKIGSLVSLTITAAA